MPGSKHSQRAGETAQRVKVLTAKPDDLSSTPGSHMVKKTDTICTCGMCIYTQINVGVGLGKVFLFFKRHSEVR